jgi:hypothetical protein
MEQAAFSLKSSLLTGLEKSRTGEPRERIEFEVAGLLGCIEVPRSDAGFVREYLRPFVPRHASRKADFEIEYRVAPGELENPRAQAWNDPDPEYRVDRREGKIRVIQRDFAAWFGMESGHALAVGPRLGPDSLNTIDNLIQLPVSTQIVAHGGLVLHAAVVERQGAAFVFFGDSGVGKSTLAERSWKEDSSRVLSGDQILLRLERGRPVAYPTSSTIPEFPRGHVGWCSEPKPVRALVHLVRGHKDFSYRELSTRQALPLFLKQVLYAPELLEYARLEGTILKAALTLLSTPDVERGEMSYSLGTSFWVPLVRSLRSERNEHGPEANATP